jgi:histidine triad (HIT) family protein
MNIMKDCLFCKIASGEIPSACLYEDELVHVFKDINPQAPVHFLVIPKKHIISAADINGENSKVVAHCFEIIAKLAREMKLDGFRVVSNCGESAGQSVKHLHFHVLSGRDLTWPPG